MKIQLFCLFISVICVANTFAQQSQVVPWANPDPANPSPAYRPEPILFVHGINDNDLGWNTTIATIADNTSIYQLPVTLPPTTGLNATQQPYLHTFNYGDYPSTTLGDNSNSFQHLEWNAWQADMQSLAFTNIYLKSTDSRYAQAAPNDGRLTLDERIGGANGIRKAYATDPGNSNTWPDVVLVAHSMGGLLAHYYLIQSSTNSGVRRLVTLGTPHQGTHFANWVIWDQTAGLGARIFDTMRHHWVAPTLSFMGRPSSTTSHALTHGYGKYPFAGGVEDLTVIDPNAPAELQHTNNLMTFFWNNPAPPIEYVFNVYHLNPLDPTWSSLRYQLMKVSANDESISGEQLRGDGAVADWSAAGKPSASDPSIWNGWDNPDGDHVIDPVIFGVWTNTVHSIENAHLQSIEQSIDGVPYLWEGYPPPYATMYGENQSFSKYLPFADGTETHTDEPGIGRLVALADGSASNPLVLPSFNTWTNLDDPVLGDAIWENVNTNASDFVGHQVIGNVSTVDIWGIVGCKNHALSPIGIDGTNYWVIDGNEYLPASLSLRFDTEASPINSISNSFLSGLVTNCLIGLNTGGTLEAQYGCFDRTLHTVPGSAPSQAFIDFQGQNIAGLMTPQTERAFDVPVNSATMAAILEKINQGEVISNGCFNPALITQWQTPVSEWVRTSVGTITLNFFPVSTNLNVFDAWTQVAFTNFSYDPVANVITINDTNEAPSQLIVSNLVYLGCAQTFTNSNGGIVPALTATTLAGVPMNETFLDYIRTKMESILFKYENTCVAACGTNWVLTNILACAANNYTGTWSPVTNGLVTAQDFVELSEVASNLTKQYSYITFTASGSLSNNGIWYLPDGMTNVPYSAQINVSSCITATIAMTSGTLPPGLVFSVSNTTASITGTPTNQTSNLFVVTMTDTNGCSTNQAFSLTIDGPCSTCPLALPTYSVDFVLRYYLKWDPLGNDVVCDASCSVDSPYSYTNETAGGYVEYSETSTLTYWDLCEWTGEFSGGDIFMSPNAYPLPTLDFTDNCGISDVIVTNTSGTNCVIVGSYGPTGVCSGNGTEIISATVY